MIDGAVDMLRRIYGRQYVKKPVQAAVSHWASDRMSSRILKSAGGAAADSPPHGRLLSLDWHSILLWVVLIYSTGRFWRRLRRAGRARGQ